MALNDSQREYVKFLHTLMPEQLCWCGWYPVDECGKWCERHGRGLTNADRVRERTGRSCEPHSRVLGARTKGRIRGKDMIDAHDADTINLLLASKNQPPATAVELSGITMGTQGNGQARY